MAGPRRSFDARRADSMRLKPSLDWLLVFVPVAIGLDLFGGGPGDLDLPRRLRGGDPAGRLARQGDRAPGRAHHRGDRRPAQRHLRQRGRADHRPARPARGADRRGQGLDHRLDHRQHPAGHGGGVLRRRRQVRAPEVQRRRRPGPGDHADPGRGRADHAGALPPPGAPGGPFRADAVARDLGGADRHLRRHAAVLAPHPPPALHRHGGRGGRRRRTRGTRRGASRSRSACWSARRR